MTTVATHSHVRKHRRPSFHVVRDLARKTFQPPLRPKIFGILSPKVFALVDSQYGYVQFLSLLNSYVIDFATVSESDGLR